MVWHVHCLFSKPSHCFQDCSSDDSVDMKFIMYTMTSTEKCFRASFHFDTKPRCLVRPKLEVLISPRPSEPWFSSLVSLYPMFNLHRKIKKKPVISHYTIK